jgi:hypothetical protein
MKKNIAVVKVVTGEKDSVVEKFGNVDAAYALRDRLQTESLESGVLMTQVRYAIRVK